MEGIHFSCLLWSLTLGVAVAAIFCPTCSKPAFSEEQQMATRARSDFSGLNVCHFSRVNLNFDSQCRSDLETRGRLLGLGGRILCGWPLLRLRDRVLLVCGVAGFGAALK